MSASATLPPPSLAAATVPPAARLGAVRRFALRTLAAWIVLGARYAALFVLVPGTSWSEVRLPEFIRLSLLAQGLLAVGVRAVVIAVVLGAVDGRGGGAKASSATRTPAARAMFVGGIGALVAMETLMLASWAAFYALGQFIDRESSSFFLANASLVFAHARDMAPWTLVAVPAGAALLIWLCLVVGRAFCRLAPARGRALLGAGALVAALSAALAWFGNPTDVPGLPLETQHALARLVDDRTAPMLHLAADVFGGGRSERIGPPGTEADAALTFARRPIVPMAEYAASAARAGGGRRWNVLLVIVESLRPDQLRAFGGPRTVMPTLDSIARASTLYAASETQATHTDLAVPAILSSQYPLRDWIEAPYPSRPAYPRVLIYDVLHAAGYHTGVFSSQNEAWGGMGNFIRTDGIDHFLDAENYQGPTYVPRGDQGFALWVRGERRAGKIDDRFTAAEAVAWLDSVPRDGRPVFAYLNLQSSHTPYARPTDFTPRFGPGEASFPITFAGFPADSAPAVRDLYANSLAYADAQLATVVRALQRSGRWDSTVVVVLGDHGEAFYEHGVAAHGNSLHQELTRIPLVVRVPGEAPRIDSLPAAAIDVPPTVLGALGLPAHPAFQGENLRAATATDRARRPLFLLTQTPMLHAAGVVQNGVKLMVDTRTGTRALFDLRADPGERRPLDPDRSAAGRALTAMLASWWTTQLTYYASPAAQSRWYAPAPSALAGASDSGAYAARSAR